MRWICRTKKQMMKCIKMSKKRIFVDAIKTRRWIMVEHALRHVDEPHSIIIDGMVEGKIATRRSRNFYAKQIKNGAKIEIWKTVKQKANNRTE